LANLKQRIVNAFRIDRPFTLDEFEETVEKILVAFYETHIFPFDKARRSSAGDLDSDLVIGAHIRGEQRLWTTQRTTITSFGSFVAVGAGADWATQAELGFFARGGDRRAVSIAAAYAVYIAKKNAEGFGMETDIVYVPITPSAGPGMLLTFDTANPDKIRLLEERFRHYEVADRVNRWKALSGMSYGESAPRMDAFLDELELDLSGFDLFS
jgi:hypothetical protein